jgi:hypothetical protein
LLVNEWDAQGNIKRYEYDILKRVTKLTELGAGPAGEDIVRRIDFFDDGNRSELTNEAGNTEMFYYSKLKQLIKVIPPLEVGQTEEEIASTYVYDAWGRITEVMKPAPDNPDFLTAKTTYEYDSYNRIKKVIYPV